MHILLIGADDARDIIEQLFKNEGLVSHVSCASTQEEIDELQLNEPIDFALITYFDNEHEHIWLIDHCLSQKIKVILLAKSSLELAKQLFATKSILDYVICQEKTEDGIRQVTTIIKRYIKNQQVTALVVDDSNAFRSHVAFLLSTRGLRVLTANDGVSGLEVIQNEPIRLVVTDYQMPNMDGLSLVKAIRKNYQDDQLAIIAFTASQGKYTADFLKMGANDFLNKPFSREELTCRIDRSLDMLFMVDQLRDSAERDVLTGLHNRRYFLKHSEQLFQENRMQALAILDIDFFKKINDCYGHETGDVALRCMADIMRDFMAPGLLIARLGGEEFCIVFSEQFNENPREFLEKLRVTVSQKEITFINSSFYQTLSIGLVDNTKDHLSVSDIMMLADNRLYKAKHQGRNQVVDAD